jgi:hypothetical protein
VPIAVHAPVWAAVVFDGVRAASEDENPYGLRTHWNRFKRATFFIPTSVTHRSWIMDREYEAPRERVVERSHTTDTGSGMGIVLGLVIAFGIIAILFFAFYDRGPTGPATVTSQPTVTAPQRTAPKTTPPANTAPPTNPSTK